MMTVETDKEASIVPVDDEVLDAELDDDTVLVDDGNVQIGESGGGKLVRDGNVQIDETGERQTGERWKCTDCAC